MIPCQLSVFLTDLASLLMKLFDLRIVGEHPDDAPPGIAPRLLLYQFRQLSVLRFKGLNALF